MAKEVYDSIRKIDDKEEKINKIIEKNMLLNALERYMLMIDFDDADVLKVLKAVGESLDSFSIHSLLRLLKSDKAIIEGFLRFGEKLETNDLVTLINCIEQPLVKLQVIMACKGNLTTKGYFRILKSCSDLDMMEKIIDIWNHCPLSLEINSFLKEISDEALRKRLAELFLMKRKVTPEKIASLKAKGEEKEENFEKLSFFERKTFGVELEFEGVDDTETLLWDYIIGGLQKDGFEIKDDVTLKDCSEIVSPILSDDRESWKKLYRATEFAKKIGGKATENCGVHIHFGADIFEENPEYFRMFLQIWQEVEPLLYMVSNQEGEKTKQIREKSIKPIAHKIQEMLMQTKGKNESIQSMIRMIDVREKGYSVNLRNMLQKPEGKYTIEFRIPNGSLEYGIIRENIDLFARILWLSKELVRNPEYNQEAQTMFFRTEIDENEKLKALLDLVFTEEAQKEIYIKRFDSIKDDGFVIEPRGEVKFQPSFIYKELEKIAGIVPGYLQDEALAEIVAMTTEREIEKKVIEH